MISVDAFAHPIVLINGVELPVMMSRIDVLAPILDLKGLEEELVLDLHYSLGKTRTWNASAVREIAASLRDRIIENTKRVVDEVGERVDGFRSEEIVSQWTSGLGLLATVAIADQTLSWERRVDGVAT